MEVSLSLMILGLVTVFIMNLFPTSMITVKKAEHRQQANLLAESVLAELAALPFEDLIIGDPPVQESRQIDEVTYQIEKVVLQADSRNPDFIKNIRVEISWEVREIEQTLVRELWVANLKR
jgi:hypothetical protein